MSYPLWNSLFPLNFGVLLHSRLFKVFLFLILTLNFVFLYLSFFFLSFFFLYVCLSVDVSLPPVSVFPHSEFRFSLSFFLHSFFFLFISFFMSVCLWMCRFLLLPSVLNLCFFLIYFVYCSSFTLFFLHFLCYIFNLVFSPFFPFFYSFYFRSFHRLASHSITSICVFIFFSLPSYFRIFFIRSVALYPLKSKKKYSSVDFPYFFLFFLGLFIRHSLPQITLYVFFS